MKTSKRYWSRWATSGSAAEATSLAKPVDTLFSVAGLACSRDPESFLTAHSCCPVLFHLAKRRQGGPRSDRTRVRRS